jgi:hypothetical protein
MAHNVIPRRRVVGMYQEARQKGATHEQACEQLGEALGLDGDTVAWIVNDDKTEHHHGGQETSI